MRVPPVRVICLLTTVILLAGCGERPQPNADDNARPVVIATVPMIGDLAREIAGGRAEVRTLLREGVDPHTYSPTAADVRQITSADLLLYNGLLLEGVMQDRLAAQKNALAVAATLPKDALRTPDDFAGHPDPHVWMDVSLWEQTVPAIRDALIEIVPDEFSDELHGNADQLAARLRRLHQYATEVTATIPQDRRRLVTAHDAFGYFARAYGVEVFSVQGVSTESAAGVEDVNRLVRLCEDENIPAVFMETNVSPRYLEAVIAGAADRGVTLQAGGPLYSDSAGKPGTWEATYFGMIDHNLTKIVGPLGGTVPEGGFRGWEERNAMAAENDEPAK